MRENGREINIRSQPFARAERIHEIVTESNRLLKSQLPLVLRAMQLYLASRDTEIILFRPIKVSQNSHIYYTNKICCVFNLRGRGYFRVLRVGGRPKSRVGGVLGSGGHPKFWEKYRLKTPKNGFFHTKI